MEYDVEIKPTKLVKGQCLAKLLTESNCQAFRLNVVFNELLEEEKSQHEREMEHIFHKYDDSAWYNDIVYFLLFLQSPLDLDKRKFRSLKLKAMIFCIVQHNLFWKYHVGILLRCVDEEEVYALQLKCMKEFVVGTVIGRPRPINFL